MNEKQVRQLEQRILKAIKQVQQHDVRGRRQCPLIMAWLAVDAVLEGG